MPDYYPLGALEQYMVEIKNVSYLSEEEEHELFQVLNLSIDSSLSFESSTRLAEAFQPFVVKIAKRYSNRCKFLELGDLIQEGNIGLLQAIAKYDSSKRSTSFQAWAATWIKGSIIQAILRAEGRIRLPTSKIQAIRKMHAANDSLLAVLKREPTLEELATYLQISLRDVIDLIILYHQQQPLSLETLIAQEHDGSDDTIARNTFALSDDASYQSFLEMIDALPPHERLVIALRYGIEDGNERSWQEIATLLEIPRSQVDNIYRKAKSRLYEAWQHSA
jgi:RNA polymerase primary sigma factor